MNKASSYSDPRRRVLFLGVAALVLVTGFKVPPAQDVIRLETRINQLEQRLYTMETSIRSIEQQSRIAAASSRGGSVSADEFALVRAQLQALQVRVMEDECALAKLDERTLAPARRKSTAGTDPCRANVDAPLRLPERRE